MNSADIHPGEAQMAAAMSEFQPPDVEEDRDAMWQEWFDRQEKNGYAVLSRDEWHAKLDDAAKDGYAEGRSDEREEWTRAAKDQRALVDEIKETILDLTEGRVYPDLMDAIESLAAAKEQA